MKRSVLLAASVLFHICLVNSQDCYKIYFNTFRVFNDSVKSKAGVDLILAIKDSQSYTYYNYPESSFEAELPLGKSYIAKSTYFNLQKKLIIDPYGYRDDPKTHALIVWEYPDNKWKVTNEKKVILGDTCLKATGRVGDQDIIAWFSPKLPSGFGIHLYLGLPGTILETVIPERNLQSIAIRIERECPEIVEPNYYRRVTSKTFLKKRSSSNPKVRWKEKDFITQ